MLVVAAIALLARRIDDPPLPAERPRVRRAAARCSRPLGLFFVVFGILQTGTYGWGTAKKDVTIGSTVVIAQGGISPVWILVGIGPVFLALFFVHVRARERRGRSAAGLHPRCSRTGRPTSGLITQNVQWLVLQGSFFVISVFLQQERGYSAIQTGLMLLPATIGILLSSASAQRMASRHPQRLLIRAGFTLTVVGLGAAARAVAGRTPPSGRSGRVCSSWASASGAMLTASVNVVQSAWPEEVQGDISGVSRSVSNLGSSLGVAIAGSVLVAATTRGDPPYLIAILVMAALPSPAGWRRCSSPAHRQRRADERAHQPLEVRRGGGDLQRGAVGEGQPQGHRAAAQPAHDTAAQRLDADLPRDHDRHRRQPLAQRPGPDHQHVPGPRRPGPAAAPPDPPAPPSARGAEPAAEERQLARRPGPPPGHQHRDGDQGGGRGGGEQAGGRAGREEWHRGSAPLLVVRAVAQPPPSVRSGATLRTSRRSRPRLRSRSRTPCSPG